MNGIGKYTRNKATSVDCSGVDCYEFNRDNDLELDINMNIISLTVTGTGATTKSITLRSETNDVQIFTAVWNVADDIYSDSPISDTGWTTFKNDYVTDSTGADTISVNYEQWAADNGSILGEQHLFRHTVALVLSGCTKSKTYDKTITVSVSNRILSESGDSLITESGDYLIHT